MEHDEQAAERGLPDLPEQIDMTVGRLTVLAQALREQHHTPEGEPRVASDEDVAVLEQAMLLLAGLQQVVCWEPNARLESARDVKLALRTMASIGPRPPAVVMLLGAAVGHMTSDDAARAEQLDQVDEELAALLLVAEREAYDLAEQSLAQGRRLAELQARVGAR